MNICVAGPPVRQVVCVSPFDSLCEDGEVVQVGVGILSESECEARTVSYEVVSER